MSFNDKEFYTIDSGYFKGRTESKNKAYAFVIANKLIALFIYTLAAMAIEALIPELAVPFFIVFGFTILGGFPTLFLFVAVGNLIVSRIPTADG